MSRRAQTEIAGLVVVVILITLGLFFSIALRDTGKNVEPIEVYSEEKLSGDFLIALLETDVVECGASVQELSLDCVRWRELGVSQYEACTDPNPCYLVETFVSGIVDQTLERWGKDYELKFVFPQTNVENGQLIFRKYNEGGCTEFSERSAPGIQPLPSPRGIRGSPYYQLDLCRP